MTKIGDKVRIENPGNSFWGDVGVVERIQSGGPFDIVTLNMMEPNPEDRKSLRDFSENELSDPL